jgi:hypothetical protein
LQRLTLAPPAAYWRAARALGKRDGELLSALGFQVERLDNLTSLLRSTGRGS